MDYSQRFKIVTASYLMLIRDDKILLSRRFNTGYEDGNYSLPAGHVDEGETLAGTLVREAKEEIDITLDRSGLELKHVMHRGATNLEGEYISFFFVAKKWQGEPKIMEPHKCDDLKWFLLNDLPVNLIPYVRVAIESALANNSYSEFGW